MGQMERSHGRTFDLTCPHIYSYICLICGRNAFAMPLICWAAGQNYLAKGLVGTRDFVFRMPPETGNNTFSKPLTQGFHWKKET